MQQIEWRWINEVNKLLIQLRIILNQKIDQNLQMISATIMTVFSAVYTSTLTQLCSSTSYGEAPMQSVALETVEL